LLPAEGNDTFETRRTIAPAVLLDPAGRLDEVTPVVGVLSMPSHNANTFGRRYVSAGTHLVDGMS